MNIFTYISNWWLNLNKQKNTNEILNINEFKYSNKIYSYNFKSEYNFNIKKSLDIIKELIKLATKNNVGDVNNINDLGYEYLTEIRALSERNKLDNKNEFVYELVKWLHYYDENKKDFYHYEPNFVLYYLEQVQLLLSIYGKYDQEVFDIRSTSLHSLFDHFVNSHDCIQKYIIDK